MSSGVTNGQTFYSGVSSLESMQAYSIDAKARQITTLVHVGADASTLANSLSGESAFVNFNGYGAYHGYSADVLDSALALSALSIAGVASSSATSCSIFAFTPQGTSAVHASGWGYSVWDNTAGTAPISASTTPLVLPTAYAVLYFKNAQQSPSYSSLSCANGDTLSSLITAGVAALKGLQNSDGGFGDASTSSVLETAVAAIAIAAVNPSDASLPAAYSYLQRQQGSDGSWDEDTFQTALALQALPSTVLVSTAGDGVPDAVKQAMGLDINQVARGLVPGNGMGVTGSTLPVLVQNAMVGVPFSYTFTGSGGTAPYTFSLASGTVPDGTSVSGAVLSGTPTTAGVFSFTMQQTDSSPTPVATYVEAQVVVNSTPTATKLVPAQNPTTSTANTTLVVTVTGLQPQGTVSFYDGSTLLTSLTLNAGDANISATQSTFSVSVPLAGGFRHLSAVYSGDTRNQGSTSNTIIEAVNPLAGAIISTIMSAD